MQQSKLTLTIAAGALSAVCGSTQAEPPQWRDSALGDRFSMELSAFYVQTDTDLHLEDSKYPGTGLFLNLEDTLDLDDSKTIPLLFAHWRVSERNTLRYSYWDLDRSSNSTFDIDLGTIDGEPFGPSIKGGLDIETHQLTWNYSFVFEEDRDFYAGVGLSYMDVALSLKDVADYLDPAREDAQIPVPAFVIGYDWVFRPGWIWRNTASVMALALSLDRGEDAEGYSSSLSSTVEWQFSSHFSLSAGYDIYQLDAEYERERKRERWQLDYLYHGPRVGAVLRF